MKSIINILVFILSIVVMSSCEKGNGFDCLKGTGDVIKENRIAGTIDRIILNDNINLVLMQDSIETIVIEAGEKIINSIKTELDNGELLIENTNRCNWVRSFKTEITAYVSVRGLNNIIYYGSGSISSVNKIKSDLFEIDIHDGSGSIDLSVDTKTSWIVVHLGVADLTMKGTSGVNYIYTAGFGPIDCINLITDVTFITHNGSNNCYINVDDLLEAKIGSVGDIYYKGNPQSVESVITGSGRLISIN